MESLDSLFVVATLLCAAVLGSMLFFSFVVAPLIFSKLPADVAGAFVRQVFPVYYLLLGGTTAVAGTLLLLTHRLEAAILMSVGVAFFLSRQILAPKIRELRDAQLRGDPGAERNAFGVLHRLAVIVNYVQLAALTVVLFRLVV